ncbi:MAG: FtsX-like permease family protein [Microthrixaceae bacterium]
MFQAPVSALFGDVLMDTKVLASNLSLSIDVVAFVKFRDDPTPADVAAVKAMATRFGAAHVSNPTDLVADRAEVLRGFGRVIEWMLAFTVVLAVVGVANTLQLGVNERRREFGLLRAIGASRGQTTLLVLAEAAALSVVGTVLGAAIGLGATFGAVKALSAYGLTTFSVPTASVSIVAAASVLLALLAAAVPARLAARSSLPSAIADVAESVGARTRRGGTVRTRAPRRARPDRTVQPLPSPVPLRAAGGLPPLVPIGPAMRTATGPNPLAAGPSDVLGHSSRARVASGWPTPSRVGARTPMRCYSCGYEPGDGPACQFCGAVQTDVPVAAFASRVPVASEPTVDRTAVGATATTGGNHGHPRSGQAVETVPMPPPPPSERPVDLAPPPGDEIATADPVFPTPPAPVPPTTAPAVRTPVPASTGSDDAGFLAAALQGLLPPPASPAPPPSRLFPPPAPHTEAPTEPIGGSAPGTPAPAPAAATTPPQAPPTPQAAGPIAPPPPPTAEASPPEDGLVPLRPGGTGRDLVAAAAHLSPEKWHDGEVPLTAAAGVLGPDEVVFGVLVGRSFGQPSALVVTQLRVIVVSGHGIEPPVDSFDLDDHFALFGRHANGFAAVTISDDQRLHTVDQIPDVVAAFEFANIAYRLRAAR